MAQLLAKRHTNRDKSYVLLLSVLLSTGIQVQSIIFLFLTDRDKQRVLCGSPWQLLTQELNWRFCSEAGCPDMKAWLFASTNTYVFCALTKKWASNWPADEWRIKNQMEGNQMLAPPCKYVTVVPSLLLHLRSSDPNAPHRWHMAMTSTWGMRSQRSRGQWSCLMGWASRIWVPFDMTLKAKKMNQFWS